MAAVEANCIVPETSRQTITGHLVDNIARHRVTTIREPLLYERLGAEFTGTFFLVFTVGVSVVGGGSMAAVAIGLVLGIQIYTFGAVSGGMLNPAVTLAVLLSGRNKISPRDAGFYALVQLLAGIVGGLMAFAVTGETFYFDFELTPKGGWGSSLALEILFTLALCNTVLTAGTSNDAPNQYFGFAIGLTVTGGALASGGFDQGSLNPAVTLGINLASAFDFGKSRQASAGAWVLFLLAPLLGGALAAGVFRLTRGSEYEQADLETQVVVKAKEAE